MQINKKLFLVYDFEELSTNSASAAMRHVYPNRVARQIAGAHKFNGVWVMHLNAASVAQGRYSYMVAELDVSEGDAPVSQVTIAEDFESWVVERVQ